MTTRRPVWKTLDHETVEALVRPEVYTNWGVERESRAAESQ
ncbi:MAG: hypothetical protein ACR2FR_02390 [Rubrobacter sp.]